MFDLDSDTVALNDGRTAPRQVLCTAPDCTALLPTAIGSILFGAMVPCLRVFVTLRPDALVINDLYPAGYWALVSKVEPLKRV